MYSQPLPKEGRVENASNAFSFYSLADIALRKDKDKEKKMSKMSNKKRRRRRRRKQN
jgi:hypothetical protein